MSHHFFFYGLDTFIILLELYMEYMRACMLTSFSCVQLFENLMSTLFMRFSRKNTGGIVMPPPGHSLPKPGTEPASLDYSCSGRQQILYQYHLGIWNIYIPPYIPTFIELLQWLNLASICPFPSLPTFPLLIKSVS